MKQFEIGDYIVAKHDIYTPGGDILFKKGKGQVLTDFSLRILALKGKSEDYDWEIAGQPKEELVDFDKLYDFFIDVLSDPTSDCPGDVSNMLAFFNKLAQSSSFAHKAHKELQKRMK